MAVGPPSAQWVMWWPSHQAAGPVAAGERAAAVAGDHGPADPGRDGVAGPADVQGLAGAGEQDGDDPGVTGDAAGGGGGDRPTPVQLPGPQSAGAA